MNYSMILYLLGWVLNLQSICMLLPISVGLFYHEEAWKSYAVVAAALLVIGLLLIAKKPKRNVFYAKEGFATVAASWLILSFTGAIPFVISGEIPNYLDALFEMASGFSTTGASILSNVEALSHSALIWRCFSNWIGGMGVLVFILAIVPLTGGHVMQLMKAESPGPSVEKIVPKVRQTAVILYAIYISLTILETILLLAGGMPWFDSLAAALATAGTGGFGIKNAGMGFYSNYLQSVITVFMILFGVNFTVYYLLLAKKVKQALKSEELWWYIGIIAFSIICITMNVKGQFYGGDVQSAVHDAAFSVASIISTTGFSTADFSAWPQLSKFILFILMFVGASAGSTGGGMKVSRIILLVKSSFREIGNIVHPRGVNLVKLDGRRVDNDVIKTTKSYFVVAMIIYIVSAFIVSFDGFDMTTTLTAVAATLYNIGPGLELVGPTGNFAMFSPLSKIVLIFDMLAGRLEFFPMLVLFSPQIWKGSFSAVKRRIIWKKESLFRKESR